MKMSTAGAIAISFTLMGLGLGSTLPGCGGGGGSRTTGKGGTTGSKGGSSAKGGAGGKGGTSGAKGGASGSGSGGSGDGGSMGTGGGSGGMTGTGGAAGGGNGAGGMMAKGGAAGTMLPATAPVVPTNGLIGYWKFDEGTGTTVKDSSPSKADGTIVTGLPVDMAPADAAPAWEDGAWGKTFHFNTNNATGNWISVPSKPAIETPATTNSMTIAAWVKWEIYGQNWNFFIQKQIGGTGAERYALGENQGLALAEIWVKECPGAATLKLKQWMHMAMTYDGTTIHYYENGTEAGFFQADQMISTGPEPITLGCGANFNATSMKDECNERFKGWLDELVMYDRALSDAEIKALAGK